MIRVIYGDITNIKDIDTYVNTAKNRLTGGGGLDGVTHYKAGEELLKECQEIGYCETGKAVITKGYGTGYGHIIHTVGPVYYDDMEEKCSIQLRESYMNSLELAKQHNLTNIALPAISTGAYCFPMELACPIAIDSVLNFLRDNPDFNIDFVLYKDHYAKMYMDLLKKIGVEFQYLDISGEGCSDFMTANEYLNSLSDPNYKPINLKDFEPKKSFLTRIINIFKR